jgi:exonuclease VII small subunit
MDSELREYLDRHFEENRQHLERHVDARFEENRQHLERHVDTRFEENQEQISELRNHVDARFEKVDGQIRQTHVVIEEVRGLVQTVAEGVVAVREAQQEINRELKADVGEVRDLLTASYRHLDQRLKVVEGV